MDHRSDVTRGKRSSKTITPQAIHGALTGDHVTFHPDRTGGVLFDRRQQRLYHADRAAAFVWCCFAEGRAADDIAVEFAHRSGIPEDEAKTRVEILLDDWRACGLLSGPPIPPADAGDVISDRPNALPVPCLTAGHGRYITTCRILDTTVAVRFGDAKLQAAALPLIGAIAAPAPAGRCESLDVERSSAGIITLRSGIQELYRGRGTACIAPAVLAAVVRVALAHSPYFPAVHAGFVAGPHGAALLPAPSGSGKSTLVAGLWSAGLSALSDDTVALDMQDMTAHPANPYICLKSGAWAPLRGHVPDLMRLPRFRRPDGFHVRYLMPRTRRAWDHALCGTDGIAVRAMIFCRYRRGGPARFDSLSTAEALAHFFPCVDPIGHQFAPGDIDRLIDWIDSIERYEMVYEDLDHAVTAVRKIIG